MSGVRDPAADDDRRPSLVLMLGEPGSGKTTLGTELGRALRIPFLARDDVRTGIWFTSGGWSDRPGPIPSPDRAVDTFLAIVESMVGLGVSAVVEYLFREARPQDLERLTAAAHCVGVRTWCADAPDRHITRERRDRLIQRDAVLDALGHESIEDRVAESSQRMAAAASEMRSDFEFPVLEVGTDVGYDPPLDEVVGFVIRSTGRDDRS